MLSTPVPTEVELGSARNGLEALEMRFWLLPTKVVLERCKPAEVAALVNGCFTGLAAAEATLL